MAVEKVETVFADDLNACFARTAHTIFDDRKAADGSGIAGNGTKSGTVTVDKPGWYPLGVLEYQFGSTGASLANLYTLYLSERSSGSAKVTYRVRNNSSNEAKMQFIVVILWVKEW